uniref:Putative secreted protein n=1 Tax=Ixodes ricinus TaxID=34613 RepID=A0A6B0V1X0_IXORI
MFRYIPLFFLVFLVAMAMSLSRSSSLGSRTTPLSASVGLLVSWRVVLMGCLRASMTVSREVSLTSEGLPSRISMYLAATPVPSLAEYTPRARRVTPAAVAETLSQSEMKALKPSPNTAPAVLMDSRTVALFSAALTLICSMYRSWFSLSTLALACSSASSFFMSFLCRSSISCSIVDLLRASCLATDSSCRLRLSSLARCCCKSWSS